MHRAVKRASVFYCRCVRFLLVLVLCLSGLAGTALAQVVSGTKTVGPTGDYPSLTAALANLHSKTLGGPLVLELQASYVSTGETFPLMPWFSGASATNTVTIRPAIGAVGLSITCPYTDGPITSPFVPVATVDLDGAQFVIFDGRPGGVGTTKELTIANTNFYRPAVRFINEASTNTLRYLTLQSVNFNPTGGTVMFSTSMWTGNNNNTIDHCDLRDGDYTPVNAIYSLGSTGTPSQYNSGNTVSNCNIFNFYSPSGDNSAGVRLDDGNFGWTIIGNSFYQTDIRPAVTASVRAVFINFTSDTTVAANNFVVANNFIGGSMPNAGGAPWTVVPSVGGVASNYLFQGIHLNVGIASPSSVQGNFIQNIVWTGGFSSTLPGAWSGIYVAAGDVNIGTVTGNTIGSSIGMGAISVSTGNGTTFGIGSKSPGAVVISGNTIGAITTNGTSNSALASLVGIQISPIGSGTFSNTIANNLIGSAITANSLNALPGQQVTGILSSSPFAPNITGNLVANLNNGTITGSIRGIVTTGGAATVIGNTVRNLSTASVSTGLGIQASVVGISQSSTSGAQNISQNVVHSLANISTFGGVNVVGIYYAGSSGSSNIVARNLVHSLSVASTTSSALHGMVFDNGKFTAQNNMVRVGIGESGTTAGASQVYGINDTGTTVGRSFYHNSVYVGGTQTSGANATYAFYSTNAGIARDFRNNIFANARSNSGATSKHYAVRYGGTTANDTTLVAGCNLFFASGIGGVLGSYNSADLATLASWRAATGKDASSAIADPLFINPTGNGATVNLHLHASNLAEGGGVPIATVIDDFDGQTRSGLTPTDIGADAGNFTSSGDIFAPDIRYPLLSNASTANRTLTGWATIEDNSGTISSGASAPRLYYKKSTDADAFLGNNATSDGWKYAISSGSGSSYNFTIDYSIINGGSVSVGDTIQYFVVAQDAANNLASSPAAATASANPPVENINGKTSEGIHTYSIVAPLSGTITAGSGSSYPTLTGAGGLFAALNSLPVSGNLTVNIVGNLTLETGGIALNPLLSDIDSYPPVANPGTLTIQPDSAVMRTISSSSLGTLIRLNGTNRVLIDGSFGGSGRYLTLSNDRGGSVLTFINDASNNTVRNCVVQGSVSFGTGLTTGNDNNAVTGNQIRSSRAGRRTQVFSAGTSDIVSNIGNGSGNAPVPSSIVSSGTSDTVSNSGNIIANNELFNDVSPGVSVSSGSDSWTITDNTIFLSYDSSGIYFNGLGTNIIRGNTIRDLAVSIRPTYGIYISGQSGNTTVAGNMIRSRATVPSSNSNTRGIAFAPNAGHNVTVVNNMIALNFPGTTAQNLSGIYDNGAAGSTTLAAHNTVLITGIGSAGADTWAYNRSGNSTATVKNNIFLNLRTGGGNHFAANRLPSNTGPLTMDYNIYAGTGLTNPTDFFDASNGLAATGSPISYAQWQTNVPTDIHSTVSGNFSSAMFIDPMNGNLHLVPGGNPFVNNKGTPIVGITSDLDGDVRSLIAPDIGADEFTSLIENWRLLHFGSTTSSGIGASLSDADADGIVNLVEFAFGLDPNSNASLQLPQPQRVGDDFTVSFTEPSSVAGITYAAEWSPTLLPGSWTPVADTGSGGTHTFSVPVGSTESVFLRFVVSEP